VNQGKTGNQNHFFPACETLISVREISRLVN